MNKLGGYSLFTEVENKELQAQNRATVLANIMEDNMYKGGRVTAIGMQKSLEYWSNIQEEQRSAVYGLLGNILEERGFA